MSSSQHPRVPATRRNMAWAAVAATLGLVMLWPVLVGQSYLLYVGTLVVLYAIGAVSLHLVFRLGQVSLGHAAFVGVGGYASVLLTSELSAPWPLAFLAGALCSGLMGLAVGPVVLRLRGVYFSLFTFTFGEFIRLVFVEWADLTGGSEGISAIKLPSGFATPTTFYYLALLMAVLCLLLSWRMLGSSLGTAIESIRASEGLARSNGVPVYRIKIIVFTIACAMAGLQGALQATFVHYVSPTSYAFAESLRFVVINIISGLNSLWGPLVGAIFIVALPELLRQWVDYQWVAYGVVLILVMRYLPGGLAELGHLVSAIVRSRGAPR